MVYDKKDWMDRMDKAKTAAEISSLIMQLPDRPLHQVSKERRDFFTWEDEMIAKLVSSKKREET